MSAHGTPDAPFTYGLFVLCARLLRRLRVHGLIKRIGRTYKYYVTDLGRRVLLTGLKLTEMVVIPQLAAPIPP